jgi:hypothetical protein
VFTAWYLVKHRDNFTFDMSIENVEVGASNAKCLKYRVFLARYLEHLALVL